MPDKVAAQRSEDRLTSWTARDLLAIVFRQRRLLMGSFVAILVGVVLSGVLFPKYEAQMKVLVRRERVDPVVTAQQNAPPQFGREEITEADLNSEVELLRSQDLLKRVVLATGLQSNEGGFPFPGVTVGEEVRIAKAVRRLARKLTVEPVRKTNLISVSYQSSDPGLAARVLNSLAGFYLEKHLAVHRPGGEFKFFDQQTEQYRNGLARAETRLSDFTRERGVVSAQLERDIALQKLNEFDASLQQTQAAIAETEHRIRSLEAQAAAIPARITTQVRTADNPQLLQQMKSTLLQLELKRTELLSKFEPGYRLVQEVEQQIAKTRTAIADEEKAPVREETTDQDPTYQWVKSELAKARTELSGLRARAAATRVILTRYRENTRALQQHSLDQQDLLRAAKTEEDNYLLYLRKEEEARISDALDQRGILNVALAEQPTVPALPARSPWLSGLLAVLLAGTASVGLAVASDFFDPSFRTPEEVTVTLGSPVLASIPKNGR